MRKFYIGDMMNPVEDATRPKDAKQVAFEKGYRDLRSKLVMMGMFKSNKLYYVWKSFTNVSMWATACAMVYYSDNMLVHLAAALLLGLFFQQCGWLAHDFLHHQVYRNRQYGDYTGLFWGNLMQGFSVQWWKNKHNTHQHITSNDILNVMTLSTRDGVNFQRCLVKECVLLLFYGFFARD